MPDPRTGVTLPGRRLSPVKRPDSEQGVPPLVHQPYEPRRADATHVFVDESGRRHGLLRVAAAGTGSVVGGFGVLMLLALLSGLTDEPPGGWGLLPQPRTLATIPAGAIERVEKQPPPTPPPGSGQMPR